jgi:hypothetical protein
VDSQAIAKWAEQQPSEQQPSELHKGKGSTLRAEQIATLLQLHKLHKTQTEIAQAIGCDQGTVSRWLSKLTDTTELAGTYLRGQALRMAKNVVKSGQARDHIQALKGLRVLAEDSSSTQIAIGINLPGLTFASPAQGDSVVIHSVSDARGSDNS